MLQYVCAAFRWRAFCEDREYFMFKTVIRGKSVITDDDARDARVYLENRLTRDEFDTIFGWARENKKAFFQDDDRRHCAVAYDDDTYTVSEIS